MASFRKPIHIETVIEKIWKYRKSGENETVGLKDTLGRFLGEDIIATTDIPRFNKSPYDGFALRAIDIKEATSDNIVELMVIDCIGAGMISEKRVQPFEAIRIMTGAQLPDGCDAVMMLELVKEITKDGAVYIQVKKSLKQGENISFKGEDIVNGKKLLEAGIKVNPGIQSILATFGYSQVEVKRQPVIGVFATGSELLDVEDHLAPGKIRNSNSYMLCGQIERSGGKAIHYGLIPDSLEKVYHSINRAIEEVDILVTTGGVSVGDFDYMPIIYEKLHANVLCNKIAMRPGSVTTVAEVNGKLLFGLSGNPSACYVGFELFLRPLIRDMLGSKKPFAKKVKAVLGTDFPKVNPFTRFVRSKLYFQNTKLIVKPIGLDKSGVIYSLALADCLLVLPGGSRGFQAGMEVDVLLLEDQEGGEKY
ncbi:molybdopterin molybdotransferase MoeA [Niallia nealsonii]|uniref:Molybdopterin molybdenumtransferase n=1 Tax=Niallia nealsonii TaxID=115979 RepID=A0A2N0YYE1_9BACI|nr:gephyrin-like molybdotransferase Glp [Niallia nealsonii]PKG22273.1 molybdopterin molybdenumtransferase [Niallia nealsonii]